MLKGVLGVIAILFIIFAFLVWSFDLTSPDQTEDNLIRMIKEAVADIGRSIGELKIKTDFFKGGEKIPSLNEIEINVLKEKVLEYEK